MVRISKSLYRAAKIRSAEGCSSGSQRKTTGRTRGDATHDFLKQTLYPVSAVALPNAVSIWQIEQRYLQSLRHVCRLYGFEVKKLPCAPFPINLYLGFQQFKEQFETKYELQIYITGTIEHPCIAISKTLEIGFDLYYLPLEPLYKLLSTELTKPLGHLLLSAYNYLQYAGVSLCDSSSFLGYEMDMIRNSYADNADEYTKDEMKEHENQANQIIGLCEILCTMITDPSHGVSFGERLQRIIPKGEPQTKLVTSIAALYDLHMQFPHSRFTDRLPMDDIQEGEDARVFPEQYLTFYWGGDTAFDDQLADWINSSLQETCTVKSPMSVQVFDRQHDTPCHEFEYEERLLKCITQLNSALYDFISK